MAEHPAPEDYRGEFDHQAEAHLILTGESCEYGCPHSGCQHEMRMLARAQAHATLAFTRELAGLRKVIEDALNEATS